PRATSSSSWSTTTRAARSRPRRPWRPTCAPSTATRRPRPSGSASCSPSARRQPASTPSSSTVAATATPVASPRSPMAHERAVCPCDRDQPEREEDRLMADNQRRGTSATSGTDNSSDRRGGRGDRRDNRDRDNRRGGRDEERNQYLERVVTINRAAQVVKDGRRFSFAALVVVGDGDGTVGVGYGKAKEVPAAIAKGVEEAKKNFFRVPRDAGTIPHPVQGEAAAG